MDSLQKMASIYSRIAEDLDERLKIACARKKINRPTAIARAIEFWVEASSLPTDVRQDSGQKANHKDVIAFPQGVAPHLQKLLASQESRRPFEQLADIVNSGNEDAIQLATSALNLAAKELKIHARKRGKG